MNLNEEVELLKGVPIFSKIEPAKLKLLAFTSERVNFTAGQEICHQGDPGDAMYVILGGMADVLIDTPTRPDRRRRDEARTASSARSPSCATCRAPPPSRRASRSARSRSPRTCSIAWSREFPQMAIEVMRELAHRLEDTNEKLREATANKAA